MPEELPNADAITGAKKRLEKNKIPKIAS